VEKAAPPRGIPVAERAQSLSTMIARSPSTTSLSQAASAVVWSKDPADPVDPAAVEKAAPPRGIPVAERAQSLSTMMARSPSTTSLSQAASAEPYTPPTMIQLKASQAELEQLRVVVADLKANIAAGAARESALAAEVGRLRAKLKAKEA